jgi:hypothetical protein
MSDPRGFDEPVTLCAACRDGCHIMCASAEEEMEYRDCECAHSSHFTSAPERAA